MLSVFREKVRFIDKLRQLVGGANARIILEEVRNFFLKCCSELEGDNSIGYAGLEIKAAGLCGQNLLDMFEGSRIKECLIAFVYKDTSKNKQLIKFDYFI